MELTLTRKYLKDEYTIGKLLINGKPFCDTLEDKVRDYNKDGDLLDKGETKVYGKTAIPYGRYRVAMNVISPKFSRKSFYMEVCQGRLPRLLNVPHFEGILMHVADGYRGAELLKGCIGVGQNKIKGGLLNGEDTFRKLYAMMQKSYERGEYIYINITK